jgi:galactitol-specific phosphotransferase system IIB component
MKFLTVCEGGNVRSVGMAYTLKYNFGQEAVPVSYSKCTQESLDYFAQWADYIVVMQPHFADKFGKWRQKLLILDVGQDRWMNPLHGELQHIVSTIAQDWRNKNWKF